MSKPTAFGIQFDSQLERDRYMVLLSREQAGEITELQVQPGPFTLIEGFRDPWGKAWRRVTYTADFGYIDKDGTRVIEEVKPVNRKAKSWGREITMKLKLLALQRPNWRIRVWTPDEDRRAA